MAKNSNKYIRFSHNEQGAVMILLILLYFLIPIRDVYMITISNVNIRISEVIWIFTILYLIYRFYRSNQIIYYKKSLALYYVLNMLLIFISYGNPNLNHSLYLREVINTNFYVIGFILIVNHLLVDKNRVLILIQTILYSSLIFGIFSIINYFTGFIAPLSETTSLFGIQVKRMIGFASEAAYWGNLLIVPFLITLSLEIFGYRLIKYQRLLFVVLAINLLLTFSTFTYLSIAIYLVSLFILNYQNNKVFKSIILVVVFVLVLVTLTDRWDFVFSTISKIFNSDTDYSSRERSIWRIAAIRMFLDKPFLGHGVTSYGELFKSYVPEYQIRFSDDGNTYILLQLAEKGIFGIISVIALFYSFFEYPKYITTKLPLTIDKIILQVFFITSIIYIINFFILGYVYMYYYWLYMALGFSYSAIVFKQSKEIKVSLEIST